LGRILNTQLALREIPPVVIEVLLYHSQEPAQRFEFLRLLIMPVTVSKRSGVCL